MCTATENAEFSNSRFFEDHISLYSFSQIKIESEEIFDENDCHLQAMAKHLFTTQARQGANNTNTNIEDLKPMNTNTTSVKYNDN